MKSAEPKVDKAAEAAKAEAARLEAETKENLKRDALRKQDQERRRGGGIGSFIRTGEQGAAQGGMLKNVLGV